MLLGHDPQDDGELVSQQPTLSRIEDAIGVRSLEKVADALADQVVRRHRKRLGNKVKRITADIDPTDDHSYRQQQLTLFSSHYGNSCYLPSDPALSVRSSQPADEPDQHLIYYVLLTDDSHATYGSVGMLKRINRQAAKDLPPASGYKLRSIAAMPLLRCSISWHRNASAILWRVSTLIRE